MKLGRKMKLALGLSLGAIATTAAVTTMAVSCGRESESQLTGNKYIPSSALEKMNANIAKYQPILEEELPPGQKLDNYEAKVWTEGNDFCGKLTYTATIEGKLTTVLYDIRITLPSVDGFYNANLIESLVEDGVEQPTENGGQQKLPKTVVDEQLESLYTGVVKESKF